MYKYIILKTKNDDFFPNFIPRRILGKKFPYSRMDEMVDLFRENISSIRSEEFGKIPISSFAGLFRFYGNDYYCFSYNPDTDQLSEFVFEKIDTSRPWTVTLSSEGSEHIHYFRTDEAFKVLDKAINYGETENK